MIDEVRWDGWGDWCGYMDNDMEGIMAIFDTEILMCFWVRGWMIE